MQERGRELEVSFGDGVCVPNRVLFQTKAALMSVRPPLPTPSIAITISSRRSCRRPPLLLVCTQTQRRAAHRAGDGTVRSIARHCPNLTALSMVELTRTSDRSLKELGRRCPRLRLLDSSSDINVLETSHRTRVPKLSESGVREVNLSVCTYFETRCTYALFFIYSFFSSFLVRFSEKRGRRG